MKALRYILILLAMVSITGVIAQNYGDPYKPQYSHSAYSHTYAVTRMPQTVMSPMGAAMMSSGSTLPMAAATGTSTTYDAPAAAGPRRAKMDDDPFGGQTIDDVNNPLQPGTPVGDALLPLMGLALAYLCLCMRRRRLFRMTMVAVLLAGCAIPAFPWGQKGHRIIGQIAYDNLTVKARKQVDRTLGAQGIVYWANWADEIKSDTIYPQSHKQGWHYQDFDGGQPDSLIADALVHYPAEGGYLFRALDSIGNVLRDNKRRTDMEHTLRFFIHLSGDRYCPMHLAHMDDKGGNTVRMAWFSKTANTSLHDVWDNMLIESQGYSFSEYARKLETEYAGSKQAFMQASDEELLLRTYHLTEAIYAYQSTWDGSTWHYIYHWRQPMEEQLYIAGIRLAKMLNDIYR